MSYLLDTSPDFGHGGLCLCPSCVDRFDADLQMALSGTYKGVDWRIVPDCGPRSGFALYVADGYVATLGSRLAADALRQEWIDDLVAQGLVGTLDAAS